MADTTASRDWYVDVLDASVHGQYGTSVVLELLGNWLLLVHGGDPTPDNPPSPSRRRSNRTGSATS